MLIYIIATRSFTSAFYTRIHIYNELAILACFGGIFVINLFKVNPNTTETLGIVFLVIILISLVATWVMIIPGIIKDLYKTFSNMCKKQKTPGTVLQSKSFVKVIKEINKNKVMTEPADKGLNEFNKHIEDPNKIIKDKHGVI